MTDSLLDPATRALADHGAFERKDEAFAVTTTPFEATVAVEPTNGTHSYRVDVTVPTLEAAVDGSEVAPVVQEGWFETFERRIEHIGDVTRTDPETPRVRLDLNADVVHVTIEFESSIPASGAEDAKALVDFVEGTYVQGIVSGYEYDAPVAELIEQAADRSKSAGGPPI